MSLKDESFGLTLSRGFRVLQSKSVRSSLQFFKDFYGGIFRSEPVKPSSVTLGHGFPITVGHSWSEGNLNLLLKPGNPSVILVFMQEAEKFAMTSVEPGRPTWAIIVVNHLDIEGGHVDYKIRMNFTTVPSTWDTLHKNRKRLLTYYKHYYTSGFLSLQVGIPLPRCELRKMQSSWLG